MVVREAAMDRMFVSLRNSCPQDAVWRRGLWEVVRVDEVMGVKPR